MKPSALFLQFALSLSLNLDTNRRLNTPHSVWPYFRHADDIKLLQRNQPIPVNSCWSGLAAFDARYFLGCTTNTNSTREFLNARFLQHADPTHQSEIACTRRYSTDPSFTIPLQRGVYTSRRSAYLPPSISTTPSNINSSRSGDVQ